MPRTFLPPRFHPEVGFRRGQIAQRLKDELQRLVTDPEDLEGRRIRQKMGEVLLEFLRQAFYAKSLGRADEGGVIWSPTDAYRSGKTDHMGFVTGRMLSSLKVEVTDQGIRFFADPDIADYAKYFHGGTQRMPARPLWPSKIPARWISMAFRAVLPDIKRELERRVRLTP